MNGRMTIDPSAVDQLDLDDGAAIMLDSNTVLCCLDGEYYLVKASTEAEAIRYIICKEELQ